MRGLLHKIAREVWLGTLLFGAGLFLTECLFAFIVPQIEDGIGTIWSQMPWVKNLMSAMLGIELGDEMTTQVLMAIVWVHPVVLSLVCAHELILGTRVPAAEIDRGTIDVLLGWPVSRGSLYLAESTVWATTGVFVVLMALAGHVCGVVVVGIEPAPGRSLAVIVINLYALYLAVGGLTFMVSALSDRRGRVIAIVFAVLVASLLLNFLGQFWPPAQRVAFLGVLHYYQPASVLRAGGFPVRDVAVLAIFGATTWGLGGLVFARRSICTV